MKFGTIVGILILIALVVYSGWSIYKLILAFKKRQKIKKDTDRLDNEDKDLKK